jgi:TonB-linked SusC/RagA family outer membrane protein
MELYKNSKYLVFVLLLSFSNIIYSQKVIKGVVTDKSDNSPLPGANIILKNINNRILFGTTTDPNGRYTIQVPDENTILHVTFLGYTKQEIPVGDKSVINVALERETTKIDEVVVVGQKKVSDGYMNIDQRNLASAVVNLDLEEVVNSSATSVTEMIQGRAAGVQITANSGNPGAGYTIKIRGNTSLNSSNEPLIVIDNVPYEGKLGLTNISDLTSSHSPLSDVNPADIESIVFLKDAASTAIYGSKGANGVVIIKTKRGKTNRTDVTFTSNVSIQNAPKNIPLLSGDDMKILILEGEQNSGNFVEDPDDPSYPELRDDPTRVDYYNYNNNTDWLKEIQRTGYTFDNNFSLRGGGNTTRYSFSVGSTNQTGTTNGTRYDRLTTGFNLDYTISDKLSFKSSTGYTRSKTVTSEIWEKWVDEKQNPIATAGMYPSFLPVYKRDVNGNVLEDYYIPNPNLENNLFDRTKYNPYAWTELVSYNKHNSSFRTNLQVIFDFFKNFNFTSRISVDFSDNNSDYFIPSVATNRNWNDDMVNRSKISNWNTQNVIQENLLSYQHNIKDIHLITIMGVTKMSWWKEKTFTEESSNSGSFALEGMDATNRWLSLISGSGDYKTNSFMANLHYVLLDRYILQGTLNYEGSSKFGYSNRYATFPTLAVSWRISDEPFMSGFEFINDFKFRYSWGYAGNDPKDKYLFFSRYSANVRYLDKIGVTPDNIQLNTLRWETTKTNNLGMDVSLFTDRWSFTLDVYEKYTEDLLMERNLPASTGIDKYWTNFGDVRNRGIEFSTNIRILDKAFKWSFNFNISTNRNVIVYLPEDNNMSVIWEEGYPIKAIMGDPIGTFYGLKYEGVYPTDEDAVVKDADGNIVYELDGEPKEIRYNDRNGYIFVGGDAIYSDLNHDGLINDLDRVKIGDANPDFFGGFGTRLAWKAWILDCFFQYQVGNDVINVARKNLEAMPGGTNKNANQATSVLARWRKSGDITDIPRVTFDENAHNNEGSDRYVEDGSYMRLKTLSLTYNLPQKLLEKFKLQNLSVFVNGYNLLTFTNYKGQDPEISIASTNPWAVGMDKYQTARSISYTLGLKLTF